MVLYKRIELECRLTFIVVNKIIKRDPLREVDILMRKGMGHTTVSAS